MRHAIGIILLSLTVAMPVCAQDATDGAALFLDHCAICHGAGARGDGPKSPDLNPQPTDLTELKARNGGVFPTLRAVKRIDGREPLVAHGSPMPVFGPFFDGDPTMVEGEKGPAIMTTKPVADLVAWLKSVQR